MHRLLICLTLTAGVTTAAGADDCDYRRPVAAELDAAGASRLEIEAKAGFLVVEGANGATQVTVDGEACASRESYLDDIELVSERRGDRLVVRVEIPDFGSSWRGSARLDMTVTVPSDLELSVTDGSGSIEMRDVASFDLIDGSGELEVSNVYGDVRIKDGSGEIDLEDVTGRVVLVDGSGGVMISNVGGGVLVEQDGSGELEIKQVQGDVEIESDGSGGITIRDVTGTVRVGSDGSGSIWVAQVSGGFELGSDGSGTVHLDDVSGTVKMP